MAPVRIFDRANPNRNRTQLKWFEQLREDHLRLKAGVPGMPVVDPSPEEAQKLRLAAGCHEVKLPERGVAQLCRFCRKATRDSTWLVRCGSCSDLFTPVLTLFVSCGSCGGPEAAMERLEGHLEGVHGTRPEGL